MAHWRSILTLTVAGLIGLWVVTREAPVASSPAPTAAPPALRLSEIVVTPPRVDRAPSAKTPANPLKRERASLRVDATVSYADQERPALTVQGHVWAWLGGVVAVPEETAQARGMVIQSRARGFALVAASDVPEDVESFPLLERRDNGLVGVFTGVIVARATQELPDAAGVAASCGVTLGQGYPALKSYLFKSLDKTETEESITCLRETGLFKRLEWEILAAPRIAQ